MVANQTACSKLEQRSVIKVLVTEKGKPSEIYRRMCDAYGEASFSQKMFINSLNMSLPLRFWVEKTVHGMRAHWLSGNEKVPGSAVRKKVMLTVLLGHERPITNNFLEKDVTITSAFYCQPLKQNSPYLLNDSCICIFMWLYMKQLYSHM